MTTTDFLDLVNRRVAIGFPFKDWGFKLYALDRGETVALGIRTHSPERDTGIKGTDGGVEMVHRYEPSFIAVLTEQQTLKLCRNLVQELVEHELCESFQVDGKRPFDPHENDAVR